jgi:hypothetical protein
LRFILFFFFYNFNRFVVFVSIIIFRLRNSRVSNQTLITLPHLCACLKAGTEFTTSYVVFFPIVWVERVVFVLLILMQLSVDYDCLSFVFNKYYSYHLIASDLKHNTSHDQDNKTAYLLWSYRQYISAPL